MIVFLEDVFDVDCDEIVEKEVRVFLFSNWRDTKVFWPFLKPEQNRKEYRPNSRKSLNGRL